MKNNVNKKFSEYCHPYWDVLLCLVNEFLKTMFLYFLKLVFALLQRENSEEHMPTDFKILVLKHQLIILCGRALIFTFLINNTK